MRKILNRKILNRVICLILSVALFITGMPADAMAASTTAKEGEQNELQVNNQILSMQNDYTSVHMSETNGGFYISNVEGDKTVKSDNNKELLYHSDDYDTSFTSFKITKNGESSTYIFGGDYNFEGIKTSPVIASKGEKELIAKWTLGELEFTQRLELANSGSNEHGLVCLSYDVKNNGTENVQIEARILLDSAIGNNDFAYYEIPDTSYESSIIQQECIIKANEIPSTFYAYDDLKNPSTTASCVISSKGMLKQIAFAHWNSLAATDFDFAPNESLFFTTDGNDQYGTADSAMAMYYDLGTINGGKEGVVNTYYGVFSNEKIKPESNTVAFNMTAPATLTLTPDGKNYFSNCNRDNNGNLKNDGIINIQTSLKNISEKTDYSEIVVAVYASDGLTPLNENQKKLNFETNYATPYRSSYVNFKRGTTINIPFYFKADVKASASYRKVTFRVYKITDSTDTNLLYENMIHESSTYILCPGGNGKLPEITFNSATPDILYNDMARHLYIKGNNFTMLEDKSRYTLYAKSEDKTYEIPSANITVYGDENKIDILFNEKMEPGNYSLVFDWVEPPEGVDKKLTGKALEFVMSDDIQYRNDYYGILAVVQNKGTKGNDAKYSIETFKSEDDYNSKKNNYQEVLLLFKGGFLKDDTFDKGKDGKNIKYIAKSISGEKDKIVINGCMDAFDGTVTLYKKDGKINTDFDDITLNASVENTRIYKGNAGFTSIQDGTEYTLVPYNLNGEEIKDFNDEVITLVYPSALNGLMTIAGMAFNLSFARMGMMYKTEAERASDVKPGEAKGFIMSFSARLDLSFLIPLSKRGNVSANTGTSGKYNVFSDMGAKASDLRDEWVKTFRPTSGTSGNLTKKDDDDDDKGETQGTVEVKNVLYGMNQGFIGVNFEVEVKLPGYTDSMPNVEGKLAINTVNDWSFGVEGKASFLKSITLEIKLGFKSKANVPLLDNIYFFVQGVKPGINLDSAGVCWLLGGGGGIEDFYDTLFCSNEVPPLRLLLSVSFSVFQVLEARADLSLGLTGFGIKVSDLSVANTGIKVMDYASLNVDWIPYFKLLMQCKVSCLGVIEGKGYVVIDTSTGAEEAFEAYAEANVKIPDFIPLIGGIDVGGAALGLNTTRIWGALKVLGFSTGVSYVYGGDISFGSEADVNPTYPQYLEEASVRDINGKTWYPVGYDADKQDTLYMSLASNVHKTASSTDGNLLADNGTTSSSLHSDITKTYHDFTLGNYENGGAKVLSVSFNADTLEIAENAKKGFVVKDENDNPVILKYYDNSKSDKDNEDANANFTYNEEKKEGTIVVSFTDKNLYNKYYKVNTTLASELILYAVDPLPEITEVSTTTSVFSNTNNSLTLNWNGNSKMSDLEKMDVYLVEDLDVDSEGGTPIASFGKKDIGKKTATIQLPDTLTSGNYYIRVVYSKEDVTTGIVNAKNTFEYTNSNQPGKFSDITITNAGDLQIKAETTALDSKCDGALFKVYEVNEKGEKTELSDYNVTATKNSLNSIYAVLGGSSQNSMENEKGRTVISTEGLIAGHKYVIGAVPFNKSLDENGELKGLTYGEETFSAELTLNTPNKANITLLADKKKYEVGRLEYVQDESGNITEKTVMYDTYNSKSINFTAKADMDVSGTWVLDGEEVKKDTFENKNSISINLTELADGDHTLNIYGHNKNSDGFNQTFIFNVDTTAPTLLLTSPTNGAGFEESGLLKVSGITDSEAYITINVDGVPVVRHKTLNELKATNGEEGDFTFDVNIGSGYYKKNVEIIVSDEIGNEAVNKCEVFNNGMSNLKSLDISLSADMTENTDKEWISYSNKNLFLNKKGDTAVAMLLSAVTNNNNKIILNDLENVDWNIGKIAGDATIKNDTLTISQDGHGYVEGKLLLDDVTAMSVAFTYGAEVLGQEQAEGFKVTYMANGGTGAMTDPNSPYKLNDTVQVAKCGFSNEGKTFVSWNTKADGSGTTYVAGDKFYIKDDVTLYAIWKTNSSGTNKPGIAKPSTPKPQTNVVKVGSTHTIGTNKYKVTSSNAVTYIGTTNKKIKKITIPSTVKIKGKTYKVTVIGSNAFKSCKKLTTVTIGKNITSIGSKAFYKDSKLKKITFKGTKVPKIGKNAFKSIDKKAVFKVPKKSLKSYKKKLTKKTGFLKKTMKVKK